MIEVLCYGAMIVLTIIQLFTDVLPLQLLLTVFSISMIVIGSNRSVVELIKEFKKVHVDKSKEEAGVETMSMEDAKQFPIYAGGTLCALYGLIKFFGKEVVNPLLLTYMGFNASFGIKEFILDLTGKGSVFAALEEKKLIHLKID